jgi:hypothetical protein
LVPGKKIGRSAVAELAGMLPRVSAPAFLDQIKGSVRLELQRGVRVCRKGGQIGFRSSAFSSSSPQIETRVSLLLLWFNARGGSWCYGRER